MYTENIVELELEQLSGKAKRYLPNLSCSSTLHLLNGIIKASNPKQVEHDRLPAAEVGGSEIELDVILSQVWHRAANVGLDVGEALLNRWLHVPQVNRRITYLKEKLLFTTYLA